MKTNSLKISIKGLRLATTTDSYFQFFKCTDRTGKLCSGRTEKQSRIATEKYLASASTTITSDCQSYFLPSVNLLADYTSGEGGRSIGIPVGDLLNPVYASLNQMTQSDAFPQVENVNQNFFPKNFYDARIRTSVPLINTDLYFNRTIQGQQVMLKQYELEAYKTTTCIWK